MRFINILYTLLFVYIIAAIVFWGISLDKQSTIIYENELEALNEHVDSNQRPEQYNREFRQLNNRLNARKRQFIGEGVTFLLIILIGAGVVYTSIVGRDKLSRQQSNFILSITHELKSPIAAVKLNLETLHKRKLEESLQKTLLERSIWEANRLDDLCNNLLLASQMEDRGFTSANERIDLSGLLNDCVAIFRHRTRCDIAATITENCFVYGDPLLWRLAINNLIENAIKYGPPAGTVAIQLQREDDDVLLSVADQGAGIPDDEKTKVFRKFYRIGNENSRKTKGTGLGLYLTSMIIKQFKGAISVRDNEPRGTVFEIAVGAG